MKNQLGFYFNQDNCIGCRACEGACKQQWNVDVTVRYRKVHTLEGGKYPNPITCYLSLGCNHCEEPACIEVCPVKRIEKREKDGLVVYNDISLNTDGTLNYEKVTCVSCGNCKNACPYSIPQINESPSKGKKRYEKCIGCYPRVDEGLKPACVQTCLGLALEWDKLAENEKISGTIKQLTGFPDPSDTKPSTRFKPARKTSNDLKEVVLR
ncbi:MAG: 4Fe-4S dicluster domain-containing protein [Candidatus Firestonebacteria bacterium]